MTIFALVEEEAVPVLAIVVVPSCVKRAELGSCEVHLQASSEIVRLINIRSIPVLALILTGSTVILMGVVAEEKVGQDHSLSKFI